jgi:fatty acid desaturase
MYGIVLGTCGTRVIHSCSHNATFLSPWWNEALGELVSAPLFPFAAWYYGHVLSHHQHTNDAALDVDVVQLVQSRAASMPALFTAFALGAVPVPVRIGLLRLVPWSIPSQTTPLSSYAARFALTSTLVFAAFHGVAWALVDGWVWLAVVYMHVSGLYFLFFSQLSHIPSLVDDIHASRRSHGPWSERQVRATENYAGESGFWHFLSFGLTQQIEHHLLPGVSESFLYRARIAVRDACVRHRVPYRDNTMRYAVARLASCIPYLAKYIRRG